MTAAAEEHLERGRAARERGALEDARRELDLAVRRGGGRAALTARAEVLSDLGCVVEALADLGKALELDGPDAALFARRAQFHLQRRNYPEALADLSRAIELSPEDAWLLARRADAYKLTDDLERAQEDLDAALALSPRDEALRLARLRLLIERGGTKEASAEIGRLLKAAPLRTRSEARFYRGCLAFKAGEPGRGAADFKKVMKDWPEEDALSMRARFYWAASRAVDPAFRKRHGMRTKKEKSPKLYLCGLGIFPPYTASLEVLHAISRCDVVFDNIAGSEVREFLAEFCGDIRPASYQAWQDEPTWADAIFAELDEGRAVGFVTRGHPLVFGGLAVELIRRCRELGMPHETFGAVSSIDHILAYAGKGLGDDFKGLQAFDLPALEQARVHNTGLPLLLCFYGGLEDRAAVAGARRQLERFYPGEHACWMFGPKYDTPPAVVRVGELDKRYASVHPSLMLYVPPLVPAEAARR